MRLGLQLNSVHVYTYTNDIILGQVTQHTTHK
jgi:hypothetical protein